MRRLAATSIAIWDPVNVHAASDLLGHSNQKVTEAHDSRAGTIEASHTLAQVVVELRRNSKSP